MLKQKSNSDGDLVSFNERTHTIYVTLTRHYILISISRTPVYINFHFSNFH